MNVEYMGDVRKLLGERTKGLTSWLQFTDRYEAGWLRWVLIEWSVPETSGIMKANRPFSAEIHEGVVALKADGVGDRHSVGRPEGAVNLVMSFLESKLSVPDLKVFARFGRAPKVHELKCAVDPYREVDRGRKLFEYRKNDRDFQVGDVLDLREFARRDIVDTPEAALYTGARLRRLVTYVLKGPDFGVPEGYAVLSLGAMP
jgi:hypothetical protein